MRRALAFSIVLKAALSASGASAAACAVALSPAAVAQQAPIKIGFISTFSGPSGQLGQELLDGKGRPPRAFVPQAAPSWSTCLCHLAGWEGPPLKIQRKYSGGGAPEQSNWVRSAKIR
jgi:hypothetical protein